MQIKIDEELKELIPPLQSDELKQLESNLKNEGWRKNERIITWNGTIVDGHNRYTLCKKNNIEFKTQEKKFKDKNEVIIWMIDNQLGKRNVLPYDRVRLNLRKEDILKPLGVENIKRVRASLPILAKIDTRKTIAKASNVSHGTVDKVKFIERNAPQEDKKKLSAGTETINKIYTKLKRKEKIKEIKNELKQKPIIKDSPYEILYADPAWSYNRNVGEGIASEEYSTLSLNQIKTFLYQNKIKTEDNSVLFLWVTFPLLKEGLEVMEAWEFKYKTCGFNWIKLNKNGKPFFGIGSYTKSNSELCLMGVKGKGLPVLDNTISQIIMTEKDRHSKKPEEVADKILQLYGKRNAIELFARKKRAGWDVYGDEVQK